MQAAGWLAPLVASRAARRCSPPSRPPPKRRPASEYVNQLEAICKPDAEATQRAMKGARADIQRRTARGRRRQVRQGDDDLRLDREADRRRAAPAGRRRQARQVVRLPEGARSPTCGRSPRSCGPGHGIKAQRLTARFIHNGNLANNVVLAFGFNYCSFKFSRYG